MTRALAHRSAHPEPEGLTIMVQRVSDRVLAQRPAPPLTPAAVTLVLVAQPHLGRVFMRRPSNPRARRMMQAWLAFRAGPYCLGCGRRAAPSVTFTARDGSTFVTGVCRAADCSSRLVHIGQAFTLLDGNVVDVAP